MNVPNAASGTEFEDAEAESDEAPPSPDTAEDHEGESQGDEPVDTDELADQIGRRSIPRGYARLQDDAEAAIRREGLTQFYGLRRMWSGWLIGWVSVLICFQIILTFSIGLGGLDYSRYDWFLPLVTAQNFLQIVGMAIVVVRFLHSGKPQPPDPDGY